MTAIELDRLDRLILNTIQRDFPIEARPYQALAQRLNEAHGLTLTEAEVLNRVGSLKSRKFIRRLGAVFNAASLGYRSTLCAARVPEAQIEAFSALVNQAPQVTHNYLRSDDLNVWFTFTANAPAELTNFLQKLKKESGVQDIFVLESEKLFKIKVDFKFPDQP